jgi:2-keto-4-pentenoate hydratase
MQCRPPPVLGARRTFSALADVILSAWSDANSTAPRAPADTQLTPLHTLDDAYAVHEEIMHSPAHVARLGGVGGFKMGWKNTLPGHHALYGPLFRSGFVRSGDGVSLSRHKVFSSEAEFGFVLGTALAPRAEQYSLDEVRAAIGSVELVIELCGARGLRSDNPLHYVADALLGSCVVRGPTIEMPEDPMRLSDVAVAITVAGVPISSGNALFNPGDHPLASLAFLVNDRCVRRGLPMDAGALVIAGHCCQARLVDEMDFPTQQILPLAMPPRAVWAPGDVIRAEFTGHGSVEATLLE